MSAVLVEVMRKVAPDFTKDEAVIIVGVDVTAGGEAGLATSLPPDVMVKILRDLCDRIESNEGVASAHSFQPKPTQFPVRGPRGIVQ